METALPNSNIPEYDTDTACADPDCCGGTLSISALPSTPIYSTYTTTYSNTICTDRYIDTAELLLEGILDSLLEEEIDSMLEKILARDPIFKETKNMKSIMCHIVSKRHFSEDFLVKYFTMGYLTEPAIMKLHKADVNSHAYSSLALLLIGS